MVIEGVGSVVVNGLPDRSGRQTLRILLPESISKPLELGYTDRRMYFRDVTIHTLDEQGKDWKKAATKSPSAISNGTRQAAISYVVDFLRAFELDQGSEVALELRTDKKKAPHLMIALDKRHIAAFVASRSGTSGKQQDTANNSDPPQAAANRSAVSTNLASLLVGVPGTGKTHRARALQVQVGRSHRNPVDGDGSPLNLVTMHAALSYEEFVEGIRPDDTGSTPSQAETRSPVTVADALPEGSEDWFHRMPPQPGKGDSQRFKIADGTFLRACVAAARDPDRWHLIVLDEFNRCNVPKVLGDLLTTLEPSKRARWKDGQWQVEPNGCVTLPYSKRLFFVPDNLVVLATMNTTDRSVASLDAAVMRRFTVERIWPLGFENGINSENQLTTLKNASHENLQEAWEKPEVTRSVAAWTALNAALLEHLGPDAMLGHSYLFDLAKGVSDADDYKDDLRVFRLGDNVATALHVWNRAILPQLSEILESANVFDTDTTTYESHTKLWNAVRDALEELAGAGDYTCQAQGESALQRRLNIRIKAIATSAPEDAS